MLREEASLAQHSFNREPKRRLNRRPGPIPTMEELIAVGHRLGQRIQAYDFLMRSLGPVLGSAEPREGKPRRPPLLAAGLLLAGNRILTLVQSVAYHYYGGDY